MTWAVWIADLAWYWPFSRKGEVVLCAFICFVYWFLHQSIRSYGMALMRRWRVLSCQLLHKSLLYRVLSSVVERCRGFFFLFLFSTSNFSLMRRVLSVVCSFLSTDWTLGNWLIDWLIDCSIERSIEWLIDWAIDLLIGFSGGIKVRGGCGGMLVDSLDSLNRVVMLRQRLLSVHIIDPWPWSANELVRFRI